MKFGKPSKIQPNPAEVFGENKRKRRNGKKGGSKPAVKRAKGGSLRDFTQSRKF